MQETAILSVVTGLLLIPAACKKPPPRPVKVNFHYETLVRIGDPGENWSGPFRGIKLLKSPDAGKTWLRVNSLGFWYAENPYDPWNQFFYTDYRIVDDEKNRTYQPKLSPKWISEKGTRKVLIWSDAMKNEEGRLHTVNYRWNQMEISLELD